MAGTAFVACVLVELVQLTGVPARLPALSLLLGSGFDTRDIGWYAVGSLVGAGLMVLAHAATQRHSATRRHSA
ncbi:DUF2809 domain-containing protein [Janibacter limosus]|uniref:DUF2809 domain-containing protein n=1 Tax=Janibacter limosus TaxID=53458 RepID=A0A4P6MWK2_9MICO|nr:DUF2809 domain-containing protein [Janibacter limosus]QBF47392.1 DUF2809 domain-containing protein [Janibacter limosus]